MEPRTKYNLKMGKKTMSRPFIFVIDKLFKALYFLLVVLLMVQ